MYPKLELIKLLWCIIARGERINRILCFEVGSNEDDHKIYGLG